jgi:hypothetical protein
MKTELHEIVYANFRKTYPIPPALSIKRVHRLKSEWDMIIGNLLETRGSGAELVLKTVQQTNNNL